MPNILFVLYLHSHSPSVDGSKINCQIDTTVGSFLQLSFASREKIVLNLCLKITNYSYPQVNCLYDDFFFIGACFRLIYDAPERHLLAGFRGHASWTLPHLQQMTFNWVKIQVDPVVGYSNAGWATSNPKAKASWANQTFQASWNDRQGSSDSRHPESLEEENTQSKSTASEY